LKKADHGKKINKFHRMARSGFFTVPNGKIEYLESGCGPKAFLLIPGAGHTACTPPNDAIDEIAMIDSSPLFLTGCVPLP
jgi:hypothetical protein